MQNQSISEEFAKNILRACYGLDARLAEIENLCSISCKDEDLSKLNEAFRSLTTVLGADIMVPIYMEHSRLGRIMEPGSWLEQDPKRGKFGVRD